MKNGSAPMYYQVKMDILDKIKKDIYKIGDKLPTDFEFIEIYSASRITIRRALSELEDEGYIERLQGKGSFVKFKEINQTIGKFYSFTEEAIKMGFVPSSIFLNLKLEKPNDEVKKVFSLNDEDNVFLLERLRLLDDMIAAYDRSYIPEKIVPGFSKTMMSRGSLYKALRENYNIFPNNSEELLEAIGVDADDAKKMKIKQGTPSLLVKRCTYHDDKLVEFNYRIVNTKILKYRVKQE